MTSSRAFRAAQGGRRPVLDRFAEAFRGLDHAYTTEAHLRFYLFAAASAVTIGYIARLSGWEVAYLAVTILAVCTVELVNTALERAVDLTVGERCHPLAAQAKEAAAGAVLLTALHALFAAIYLFGVLRDPAELLRSLPAALQTEPWLMLPSLLALVLGFIAAPPGRRTLHPHE